DRQRACLVGDDADLDGCWCRHASSFEGDLRSRPRETTTTRRMRFCVAVGAVASGDRPIFGARLRVGELVAALALAQDNAFGQPLESQLRSCLLASWICEAAGFPDGVRDTSYWVALLRYVGCTGHAHEVATVFGDEIAIRAQTLIHDAANPAEVMRDVMEFA